MADAREVTPAEILAFWRGAGRERWYTRDELFDAASMSRGARRSPASFQPGRRPMTARWR
jgi:uncharacterized protein (DUF924 family)